MATTPELAPYVPDCNITSMDDDTLLVTHLGSGRVRTAATARQALIVGTGLAIAYTWQTAPPTQPQPTCPPHNMVVEKIINGIIYTKYSRCSLRLQTS